MSNTCSSSFAATAFRNSEPTDRRQALTLTFASSVLRLPFFLWPGEYSDQTLYSVTYRVKILLLARSAHTTRSSSKTNEMIAWRVRRGPTATSRCDFLLCSLVEISPLALDRVLPKTTSRGHHPLAETKCCLASTWHVMLKKIGGCTYVSSCSLSCSFWGKRTSAYTTKACGRGSSKPPPKLPNPLTAVLFHVLTWCIRELAITASIHARPDSSA